MAFGKGSNHGITPVSRHPRRQFRLFLYEPRSTGTRAFRDEEEIDEELAAIPTDSVPSHPVGLAIFQSGKIVYVTSSLTDLWGCTPEELREWGLGTFLEMIGVQLSPKLARGAEDNIGRVIRRAETRMLREDGSERWIESVVSETEHQGQPALQIACLDITKWKRLETGRP